MKRRLFAVLLTFVCLISTACSFSHADSDVLTDESIVATGDNAGGHDVVTKQDELEANLDAMTNENNEIDLTEPGNIFKLCWEVLKYEFGYYD